ncbi:MAG TPA: branched-chain amino acid ABC transporter permease [Methanosarcinaceae archaeon]|nr:branched-chain amino acid ABC transporter permease [Methanosarcinaceae archaeon]
MAEITTLIQIFIWGLTAGCIYVLMAVGLNMIFGVMKVVNFAHGEIMMLGAFTSFWVYHYTGLNPYFVMFISMLLVGIFGVIIERYGFRKVQGTGKLNEIFLSLGLIYILQNAAVKLWTDDIRKINSPFSSMTLDLGMMNITYDRIIAIVFTALILISLYLFLTRTDVGRALRATSQNHEAAMLMGVNVNHMYMLSFGIGSALAAAAGTVAAILTPFNPYMGTIPGIMAFTVIIIGGLGSIPGAIIAGLMLGLVQNFTIFYFGGAWKEAVAFVLLIIVLIIKPTGLFGEDH